MLKTLKNYLNSLPFFNKKETLLIPHEFSDNEKIIRAIFSPINLNKDQTKLKANAFKPPSGLDEISVSRLSYTTPDFCKNHGRNNQNIDADREFFGLSVLSVEEINECKCNIVYSPNEENKSHSDIKIGYKPIKGVQLPAEYQKKVNDLTKTARLYKDNNPNSKNWEGEILQ